MVGIVSWSHQHAILVAPRVAWLFSTESPLAQAAGFFLDSKCSFLAVSEGSHRVSSAGGCMGLALISKVWRHPRGSSGYFDLDGLAINERFWMSVIPRNEDEERVRLHSNEFQTFGLETQWCESGEGTLKIHPLNHFLLDTRNIVFLKQFSRFFSRENRSV